MSHRLALASSLAIALALSAIAQTPSLYTPPDLSGSWVIRPLKLNASRSVVRPETKPTVLVIHSDTSRVEMRTTTDGHEDLQRYIVDGKPREAPDLFAELNSRSVTARWEGSALVLYYESHSPMTIQPPMTVRWTLSADGKTLTMSVDGTKTLVSVYDKQ